MSTTVTATPDRVPPIPAHQGGVGYRAAAAVATPGGAVFVLAIGLLIAIIVANPNFGDPGVIIRFLGRTAPIAIAAMGQYFVIVSGEFDLSMGAVVTAQVVMAGELIGEDEGRIVPVTCLMLLVGVGIGLINGLATTLLLVPSFIVTLGTMLALTGLVRYLTGGAASQNPVDSFREIGRGGFEDVPVVDVVPYPLIIFLVLAVAASWLMRRPYGRSLIAAGDNPDTANLSGTPLWWLKTRAFIISSLSATVAGIILVGYAGVHPSVGPGLRVHRDHRRRARRRAARRRPGLGAVGRGRRVRARAAVHPAHRPRRRVHVARHRAGPDHHRRRRRRRPRLEGRPPATSYRTPPPRVPRSPPSPPHGPKHRRKLMRKIRGALASTAALLVVLTACGTDDSLDDPDAAPERRRRHQRRAGMVRPGGLRHPGRAARRDVRGRPRAALPAVHRR